MLDDFITQKQSDEDYSWFDVMNEFIYSLISPYKVYEVDCDDGTSGDLIYVFQK